MKQYSYLLFDADETLFDFKKAEYEAFHLTCDKVEVPFSDELYAVYSKINDDLWKLLEKGGTTLAELKLERFRQFLVYLGLPEGEVTEKAPLMRDNYVEFLADQSFLMEGAVEVCRALSEKYTLYIITNGISRIQRKRFNASPLMEYITDLFISEEIGVAKPSSEYFDYVTAKIGESDRSKYLVIGDSLTSDMKGAVNYGVDSCFVNPKGVSTSLPVTYTVKKLTELCDFL
jgi:YjjG family noncanonical pyrimidine nucleotidase